jgi:threonine dehydrogenase-like Zn-dependent dehydrogenase
MAEYVTSPTDFLLELPRDLAPVGFLIEPLSITTKALEHAFATRSAFTWEPETALVLGNGPLGLLALAALGDRDEFERTYCLGRRDRPDPSIDVIERLGATYVDSRETPVSEIAEAHEPMDFVYEATGYPKHAFDTIQALAPNGVGALLGVPEDWAFEVDGGALHRELVLENKALFGSVNANRRHFAAAIDTLEGLPEWFLDALVTGIYRPESVAEAFRDDDTTIKTAVEFDRI